VQSVTVTSASTTTGWTVTIGVPGGASITNGWNATFSGSSGTVTATNLGYNGNAAGGGANFGFQGNGSAAGMTFSCAAR
jgi:endo-1,4-beta-xylanase